VPGLLAIGFVAGLVAGISPCVLPVLPVVLVGWTAPTASTRVDTRRALAVVGGVVVSFSVVNLGSMALLNALGLPLDFLHSLAVAVLVVLGLAILIPPLERFIERPFSRVALHPPAGASSGLVLGLALGAVFVPCAGPVLAAIAVVGSSERVGVGAVLLTAAFALGAALPLLAVALAGERVVERNQSLKRVARRLRPASGALLIVMAVAIQANWLSGVQTWLPGYTAGLQHTIEGGRYVSGQLRALDGEGMKANAFSRCVGQSASLARCGPAPAFAGISSWLNTRGEEPLTWRELRGKVVLVDFWTYSCINCERALPHVEAWYARYRADGLVVVGVHSPEFTFEHVPANVAAATRALHVTYPVAIDDELATWRAYDNAYWPADYLVDATGTLRHYGYGEGGYGEVESFIRQLLVAARPGLALPPRTDVPDTESFLEQSPETYVGLDPSRYFDGVAVEGRLARYELARSVPLGQFGLSGEWRFGAESVSAGTGAMLELPFNARYVYVVASGEGRITVHALGASHTVVVSGYPRLYRLVDAGANLSGRLVLSVSDSVSLYDFTFG
jgi:cytochrome c biogenesis protein CcdA/thiol-disulfide isomerase/thioredoxin